jgi:predicted acetyltransferase
MTRMQCYSHAMGEAAKFKETIRINPRAKPGDYLLAERDGVGVGTSTSCSFTMWIRGGAVPCQGVAWVGTVKTSRRRTSNEDGVATQVMRETLRMARERGEVISALMPFRASFYEHFGYGLVERRNEWTMPLAVLPHGDFGGMRLYRDDDLPELVKLRQRVAQAGQCDFERSEPAWRFWLQQTGTGLFFVDRVGSGPITSYLWVEHERRGEKDYLRTFQQNYADIDALKRQMHFLASLRDQYFAAILYLPADLQLNWLLRETQIPHRPVNHAHAELRQHVRMQVRILDHKKVLEAMRLPAEATGKAIVAVHECDGNPARVAIDIAEGRVTASTSAASPTFECTDKVWAAVACGDLSARSAVEMGLATAANDPSIATLDWLSRGPLPFCHEYF